MNAESLAKVYILTNGVHFTNAALIHADNVNAKRQNGVYNLPAYNLNIDRNKTILARPQELLIEGEDGYTVCSSAVAPVIGREYAILDCIDNELTIDTPRIPEIGRKVKSIKFVKKPNYYDYILKSGRSITRIISACGYDEMNVLQWHDCAISKTCSFCGINSVLKHAGREVDLLHALDAKKIKIADQWSLVKKHLLDETIEAINIAINDECYSKETHLILISGNLADHQLDEQARIYSDIAQKITSEFPRKFAEGIVAVTAPPNNTKLLWEMKESGIEIGVFNLEAYTPAAFSLHCPGKNRLGRDHYVETITKGVEVFGWGRSWCNFVLGLEPWSNLIEGCEVLAKNGITPGANILHHDHGARILIEPPSFNEAILFYSKLAKIYKKYGHVPYYCQLALRTSLANEAFYGRF